MNYTFLGAQRDSDNVVTSPNVLVYGMPDSSHSIASSDASNGPELIRIASNEISDCGVPSEGIFSRRTEKVLCAGINFYDCGNIDFPHSRLDFLALRSRIVKNVPSLNVFLLGDDACNFPIFLGGKGIFIHFDAHDDRGNSRPSLNHGNFLRHLINFSPNLSIVQIGLREMLHPKFKPVHSNRVYHPVSIKDLDNLLSLFPKRTPCTVCIDCDVFDSAFVSDVTCPQPFGLTADEFIQYFSVICNHELLIQNISLSEFSPKRILDVKSCTQALGLCELLLTIIDMSVSRGL